MTALIQEILLSFGLHVTLDWIEAWAAQRGIDLPYTPKDESARGAQAQGVATQIVYWIDAVELQRMLDRS